VEQQVLQIEDQQQHIRQQPDEPSQGWNCTSPSQEHHSASSDGRSQSLPGSGYTAAAANSPLPVIAHQTDVDVHDGVGSHHNVADKNSSTDDAMARLPDNTHDTKIATTFLPLMHYAGLLSIYYTLHR
jgi:hypothetical protein